MAAPRYGDIFEINGRLIEYSPVGYMLVSPGKDVSDKTITKVSTPVGYGDILKIGDQLIEFTPRGYRYVSPERDVANKPIIDVLAPAPAPANDGMLTKPAPTTKTTTTTQTLPTGTPTTDPNKAPAGETGGFDPNGGPVGGVTEETGTDAPAPAPETGGVKPMRDVKDEPETPAEMTFTFFEGAERGGASPTSLYGSREAEQVTEAELREYFEGDTVNRLPEVFGTFDNYLAYMTEREQLIQSGDYDVGNWDEYTGSLSEDDLMILEGEDLTQYGDDASSTYEDLFGERTQNQSAAYNNWVNSEANQALLRKYGVNDTVYSETGDKFQWNGSAYVKTVNEDHAGLTDYVKMAMVTALTVGTGAAVAAVAPALGTVGSATLSNAITQAITTGSIDPDQLLQTAATAGLGQALSQVMSPDVLKSLNDQLGFDITAVTGIEEVDNVLNAMGMTALRQGVFEGSLDMDQIVASGLMTGAQELANFIMGPIQDAIKEGQPVTEEQRLEALRLGQSVGADAEEQVLRNMENTVNEALATQQSEAMTKSLNAMQSNLQSIFEEVYSVDTTNITGPSLEDFMANSVDDADSELADTTTDLQADTTLGPIQEITNPFEGDQLINGVYYNESGFPVGVSPDATADQILSQFVNDKNAYTATSGQAVHGLPSEAVAILVKASLAEGGEGLTAFSEFLTDNGLVLAQGEGGDYILIAGTNSQTGIHNSVDLDSLVNLQTPTNENFLPNPDTPNELLNSTDRSDVSDEIKNILTDIEEAPDTPLDLDIEVDPVNYEFEPEVVSEPPPEPEPVQPTEQPTPDDGQAGATPPPTPAPTDTENPITTGMFPEYFPRSEERRVGNECRYRGKPDAEE